MVVGISVVVGILPPLVPPLGVFPVPEVDSLELPILPFPVPPDELPTEFPDKFSWIFPFPVTPPPPLEFWDWLLDLNWLIDLDWLFELDPPDVGWNPPITHTFPWSSITTSINPFRALLFWILKTIPDILSLALNDFSYFQFFV